MKKIVITGGAGFIGINSADYFCSKGENVVILDNFSRKGSRENVEWLSKKYNPEIVEFDLRNANEKLNRIVKDADIVIHLAGQVAVTSSVIDPRNDFENNILATFNLLEACRMSGNKPIFIYSSTNKVYGSLDGVKVQEEKSRYSFEDLPFGVSEDQNLDFHSPYGCSKGASDQYVRDYSRIYGLPTVVFRQSCIYGKRQFGIEDQGWVAWFLIALMNNKEITIYGNGKQVRDLLYIDDLVKAYDLAIENIETTKGQVYNIGGGYRNTLSVWREFGPILEKLFDRKINTIFMEERPGDQPIFIADIRKAEKDLGWSPKVNVQDGINLLYEWVKENKNLFR